MVYDAEIRVVTLNGSTTYSYDGAGLQGKSTMAIHRRPTLRTSLGNRRSKDNTRAVPSTYFMEGLSTHGAFLNNRRL